MKAKIQDDIVATGKENILQSSAGVEVDVQHKSDSQAAGETRSNNELNVQDEIKQMDDLEECAGSVSFLQWQEERRNMRQQTSVVEVAVVPSESGDRSIDDNVQETNIAATNATELGTSEVNKGQQQQTNGT